MWIKTTLGNYVNAENVFNIRICELPSGDYAVTAYATEKGVYESVAVFNSKAEGQQFLEQFMKKFGQIAVADMGAWNYSGHKKDHKETRRGGS